MSNSKNNFHGTRVGDTDGELLREMENTFNDLCERIRTCEDRAAANIMRIKRRAIGQRIVRSILTTGRTMYVEHNGSKTTRLLQCGGVVDGEMLYGLDIQGAIVDGKIGSPSESMLFMLTIADKAGFNLYQFYSNILDASSSDDFYHIRLDVAEI